MKKNEAITFLKTHELDIQNAKAASLFADIAFYSYIKYEDSFGIKFSPVMIYFNLKNLDSFYEFTSLKNIINVAKKTYTDYVNNPKSLDELIKDHKELEKKLDKVWKKHNKKDMSKKELKEFFSELTLIGSKWWGYAVFGEDHGNFIDHEITPSFQKRNDLSESKSREIMNLLSHPKEQAIFNLERIEFLNICLELNNQNLISELKKENYGIILSNEIIIKKINSYLNKYFWIKTNFYYFNPLTEQKVILLMKEELNNHTIEELQKEIKNIDSNFKNIEKKKELLLSNITLSEQDKKDIYFAKRNIYWMDHRKLGMMKFVYYLLSILDRVSKINNIPYDDITVYHPEELVLLLDKNIKLDEEELDKRKGAVLTIYEKNTHTTFYGDDAKEIFDVAMHNDNTEIKGMVASKGKKEKIQGVARIITNPKGVIFNEDEILVTSMTRIEFVPLMRKAKAIVTNEGGIACHAAIVSREMDLPCIIGTKNATKVLKDGDLIEVDTTTGIVRKIE